jgi:hypothetical protein
MGWVVTNIKKKGGRVHLLDLGRLLGNYIKVKYLDGRIYYGVLVLLDHAGSSSNPQKWEMHLITDEELLHVAKVEDLLEAKAVDTQFGDAGPVALAKNGNGNGNGG